MKKLYSFEVSKTEQVNETEESTNAEGQKVTVTKTVDKPVAKRFFIKKPTRSLHDEADLFYGVRLSEGIKAGLLTRALLAKRFNNDGGTLSEGEKNEYDTLYYAMYETEMEIQRISVIKEEERTEEDKKKLVECVTKIKDVRRAIHQFEYAHISLFDQTAENRARNKTILWWVLQLAYKINDAGVEEPFFGDGGFDEKLKVYDLIEETEDNFPLTVIQKFVYFISFWYVGRASKQEDFEALVKMDNEEVPQEVKEAAKEESPKAA